MSLWRYVCGTQSKVAVAVEPMGPQQALLQFQNWVMDLQMDRRPCRLSSKEILFVTHLKAQFASGCVTVRKMYGMVKVNEYTREWDRINDLYLQLIREQYRNHDLDVNREFLKTPIVRSMLGLPVWTG